MICLFQRMDQERSLTDGQRDEFEDMLRALTLERSQIREAMGFALVYAEAAGEVPWWSWLSHLFLNNMTTKAVKSERLLHPCSMR